MLTVGEEIYLIKLIKTGIYWKGKISQKTA